MSGPLSADRVLSALVGAVGRDRAVKALTEELVWAAAEEQNPDLPENAVLGILRGLAALPPSAATPRPNPLEVCSACGSLARADAPCDVCAARRQTAPPHPAEPVA